MYLSVQKIIHYFMCKLLSQMASVPNYGPEITGNQCEVRKCEISHQ